MLAITERLTLDAGIDWAFCDTDSMALAKPDGMAEPEFVARVQEIRRWFAALDPYTAKQGLLKLEDANFDPGSEKLIRLYCFAVSAKRYALFNLDPLAGQRSARRQLTGLAISRHPMGTTKRRNRFPAPVVSLSEIGAERWQYDLWHQIIAAALVGRPDQPNLGHHPALNRPTLSRYAATTPKLLRWFNRYNAERSYHEQVRPSGS
jgi:hypothetical protein